MNRLKALYAFIIAANDKAIILVKTNWYKLPANLRRWLLGLEKAVVAGVIAALFAVQFNEIHTREGLVKALSEILGAAYVAARLYYTSNPLQAIFQKTESISLKTTPDGKVTEATLKQETVSSTAEPVVTEVHLPETPKQ